MSEDKTTQAVRLSHPMNVWSATPEFRWAVPPHTTTQPAELQQAWINLDTGDVLWRPIPRVVLGS